MKFLRTPVKVCILYLVTFSAAVTIPSYIGMLFTGPCTLLKRSLRNEQLTQRCVSIALANILPVSSIALYFLISWCRRTKKDLQTSSAKIVRFYNLADESDDDSDSESEFDSDDEFDVEYEPDDSDEESDDDSDESDDDEFDYDLDEDVQAHFHPVVLFLKAVLLILMGMLVLANSFVVLNAILIGS
ncbi:unnamed protein product [Bursaphelenchus xylophilus]|uniref:(pine wood nematode) hypothetical protein n=1 Tax=Bursaphelenchus xylophilus TaxID=6326 RepID=A0A7I8WZ28_BURXY|nr:unnamed protein product [Bursaphelenchus xylophilus]CAG9102278.1 unnamed protein product [Bursaphelenchus xylophilus]